MSKVYKLTSTLEAPVTAVQDGITNELSPPDGIERLDVVRDGDTLRIEATPVESQDKEPAVLMGAVTSRRVVEHNGTHTDMTPDEFVESRDSTDVDREKLSTVSKEYVLFEGVNHEVVKYSWLCDEMYRVLCQLAVIGTDGSVEIVVSNDVIGEENARPAEIEFRAGELDRDVNAVIEEELEIAMRYL